LAGGRADVDGARGGQAPPRRRHSGIGIAPWRLGRVETRAQGFRCGHDRLGGPARRRFACGRTRLLLRRGQTRIAQTEMVPGHAHVQPPDAPSRPGALHADAAGRQARRYRSAVRADVTTGPAYAPGDETMHDLKAELLRGLWYVALVGADVRPGRLVHKTLLGEPLLIGRG